MLILLVAPNVGAAPKALVPKVGALPKPGDAPNVVGEPNPVFCGVLNELNNPPWLVLVAAPVAAELNKPPVLGVALLPNRLVGCEVVPALNVAVFKMLLNGDFCCCACAPIEEGDWLFAETDEPNNEGVPKMLVLGGSFGFCIPAPKLKPPKRELAVFATPPLFIEDSMSASNSLVLF